MVRAASRKRCHGCWSKGFYFGSSRDPRGLSCAAAREDPTLKLERTGRREAAKPVPCLFDKYNRLGVKVSAPTDFIGLSESQLHIRNSLPNSEAVDHPEIVISTVNGAHTSAKLLKFSVRDSDGSLVTTVNIEMKINDTGSGAELMGYKRQPFEDLATDVFKSGHKSSTGEDTVISFTDFFSRTLVEICMESIAAELPGTVACHVILPQHPSSKCSHRVHFGSERPPDRIANS